MEIYIFMEYEWVKVRYNIDYYLRYNFNNFLVMYLIICKRKFWEKI